jgi:phosphopantetheinyl transferase
VEATASISHSGTIAFCGVAASGRLGVDVERCRPRRSSLHALSAATLHPLEGQRLLELSAAQQWRSFYCAWTLKEALGKAMGVGLALDFSAIAFSEDARLLAGPEWLMRARESWSFATLDLDAGAVGSVAWSTL